MRGRRREAASHDGANAKVIRRMPPSAEASLTMDISSTPAPLEGAPTLASDLLRGAHQIAAFLYGSAAERKKVYHLVRTARLPVFRLGSLLCARRSVLLAWIEEQEARGRKGR